jgi:putative intracellular protease/amidase
MKPVVHFLAVDGYADWEAALLLAELHRSGGYRTVVLSGAATPVTSMGQLRTEVDLTLDDVDEKEIDLLIVPGGDLWQEGKYPQAQVHALLGRLESRGVRIGAICGGTLAVARAGILNSRAHTSNSAELLVQHGGDAYDGAMYREELAVSDRGVITASGLGSVEFAREVLKEVGLFDSELLGLWYETYKRGRYVLPAPS